MFLLLFSNLMFFGKQCSNSAILILKRCYCNAVAVHGTQSVEGANSEVTF